MSEEEIIKKINYILENWYKAIIEINYEDIQGLLDLYNKEKEKNKKLKLENQKLEEKTWELRGQIILGLDRINDITQFAHELLMEKEGEKERNFNWEKK